LGRPAEAAESTASELVTGAASRRLPFRFAFRRLEDLPSPRGTADAPPSGGFAPLSGSITVKSISPRKASLRYAAGV
jgi:hypothetical protein